MKDKEIIEAQDAYDIELQKIIDKLEELRIKQKKFNEKLRKEVNEQKR
jgi:hypothetical protein